MMLKMTCFRSATDFWPTGPWKRLIELRSRMKSSKVMTRGGSYGAKAVSAEGIYTAVNTPGPVVNS